MIIVGIITLMLMQNKHIVSKSRSGLLVIKSSIRKAFYTSSRKSRITKHKQGYLKTMEINITQNLNLFLLESHSRRISCHFFVTV